MKEPVDKLLTGRIRQAFEDFKDPSADAGWKALRKKYPERNRRPLILWLSSAAALLIVAAGLWFVQQPEQLVALKPAKKEKAVEKAEETKTGIAGSVGKTETGRTPISGTLETERLPDLDLAGAGNPKSAAASTQDKQTAIAAAEDESMRETEPSEEPTSDKPKAERLGSMGLVVTGNQRPTGTSTLTKQTAVATAEEAKPAISEIIPEKGVGKNSSSERKAAQAFAISKQALPGISAPDEKTGTSAVVKVPAAKLPETTLVAKTTKNEESSQTTPPLIKEPVSAAVPDDPVKKSVLAKEINSRPDDKLTKDEVAKSKKPKQGFSVFAGSYFNYSEGSENQLNFGGGITSDIRLSKNLKLSTGVSIASNSLNYSGGQNLPENAGDSFHSIGDYTTGNLTTITSYHADLLALDIPVNIKYQFVPESDKFYVSAGLSSGTYLNETYAYQYRNFNTASGYSSQTADQKTKKRLNDFDLGRTLNLSLGLSTGFGKTQTISIEPFLKYPLGGLGSENLRFGSTGINLKLRFNP